ncbi:hypothetical protein Athai_09520 [Actinocatenispora thailandica]|uniref:Uncharacterized protein n=1 Tax=Actinocatenispora thailandica TaxID=227318 RepID=A0A7R7DKJ1_9ACTN|nr:hypothetical protein [Actinocatenispora thailandica]BCJ33449.1 hypothetical protein Athai_09520 [Actinocatenispora thailandica]
MTYHPPGRKRAALTLIVLTPLVAELALGSTPIHFAFLLLLWLPIYGFGVLLIREVVRRCGGGWPSLVLLGVAYELVEDGIGLQALTSPHLYGAARMAPRLFGFNTAYWEMNVVYHVVFSVLIPIALTDLLFPALRDRPYLRRCGLAGIGAGALLGVALLRATVPPSQDPGYQAPAWVLAGCVLAVAVLAVLGLAVLPRRAPRRTPVGSSVGAPRPWLVGAVGAIATGGFLVLSFPIGDATQPAFTHGAWVLVPMAAAAVLAIGTGAAIVRWSGAGSWSDRHRIWLLGGALAAHSMFGAVAVVHQPVDRIGLVVLAAASVALLAALSRRRPAVAPDRIPA